MTKKTKYASLIKIQIKKDTQKLNKKILSILKKGKIRTIIEEHIRKTVHDDETRNFTTNVTSR